MAPPAGLNWPTLGSDPLFVTCWNQPTITRHAARQALVFDQRPNVSTLVYCRLNVVAVEKLDQLVGPDPELTSGLPQLTGLTDKKQLRREHER